ncbi:hypothetical protein [Paenibacillus sp. OAS669]|uniref:hypothetical protein n=1 Tax=Paenibacillus sp. OAS669 TaxID=2663821 RepID=UPI00178A659F|nr:hypothetical protein [Paenibacillus sp. OAS669]MBE1440845.1 hypothetical protein [Paenibacillus sp. OAS669]
MKKIFIAGVLLFILHMVVACSQKELSYEQNLDPRFQKPVHLHFSKPDGQGYMIYKKIEDNETVQTILDILIHVPWENAKVSMLGLPDYKITTVNIDPTVSYEPVTYAIWLSPKKDILEVNIEGQSKFGKISKEDTAKLLSILASP